MSVAEVWKDFDESARGIWEALRDGHYNEDEKKQALALAKRFLPVFNADEGDEYVKLGAIAILLGTFAHKVFEATKDEG